MMGTAAGSESPIMTGDGAPTKENDHLLRVIAIDGKRTAIRLERSFWSAFEQIASEDNVANAEFVTAARQAFPKESNLTSAIRQYIVRRLISRNAELQQRFTVDSVLHLLNACPTPACALSSERKLRYTNGAFLRYVRFNLPMTVSEPNASGLRLQLDLPMADIFQALRESEGVPIAVGFAIGVSDRRVRGRMNLLVAPCWQEQMILGYVMT